MIFPTLLTLPQEQQFPASNSRLQVKYIAFQRVKWSLQSKIIDSSYVYHHLLNLPSYQLHLWQLTFPPMEDESSGKQNTMDLCSLLTNSPPAA